MKKKREVRLRYLFLLFLIAALFSLSLGRYWIDPATMIKVLASRFTGSAGNWESQVETVLFRVRIPRILLGAMVGAALSASGAVYQGIFRNPLVSPDILGASWGAGFGAALGLFLSFHYAGVSLSAFLFGMGAVGIVYLFGRTLKNNQRLGLILTGTMVGAVFSSGVSFLKLVADPSNTLPAITYWLMGSLTSAKMADVWFAGPFILLGLIPIYLLRWKINLLTMNDEEAKSMGIPSGRLRLILILSATLLTAAAVSVSGMIGWIGLIIPHLARMLLGSDYRKVIPGAMLLGAAYLLLVDDLARMLTTSEIPLGILTAFVGAPYFMILMHREGRRPT